MALILNKTLTGITNIDESGITTTGLTNLSYEDIYGNILENPYLVIDNIVHDKYNNYVKLYLFIYKDKSSRLSKKKPLIEKHYLFQNNEPYNTYFTTEVLNTKNIYSAAYECIQKEIFNSWVSDEI